MPQVVQGRLLHSHAADLVLALTSASKHPISKAVAKYLSSTSKNSLELEGFHSIPGSGIEARIDDKTLRGGSPKWLGLEPIPRLLR
jgi:cation transport ATPase